MVLPGRKKLPHAIPQWVAEGSWFFIILNCVPRGKNQLCRADTGEAVLAAMKFNHERLIWHCRLCLLMPDHLHAIIAFPREPGMQITITNRKMFIAGKCGVDWQREVLEDAGYEREAGSWRSLAWVALERHLATVGA